MTVEEWREEIDEALNVLLAVVTIGLAAMVTPC